MSLLDVALSDMERAISRGDAVSTEETARLMDEFLYKLKASDSPVRSAGRSGGGRG